MATTGNYGRRVSFDKDNNIISISPNNTSAGNYQSYTIPVRIWGVKINANFDTWS